MNRAMLLVATLLIVIPAWAQHHSSNWISREASDTTRVICWDDSLTWMQVPPGSMMGMMGMTYDSVFVRIDTMPLDSLLHPYDSTVIGWCRFVVGRDSMTFDLMHDNDGHAGHHQMQYAYPLLCQIHWDSLRADSLNRTWRPAGLMGWDGSSWVILPSVIGEGNTLLAQTSIIYSATAIVGVPSDVVSVDDEEVPVHFALLQNFPNPFNPTTTVTYELPRAEFVTLILFNGLGQEVARLVTGDQPAGVHTVSWDASAMPSGAYFYQLQAGGRVLTRRMAVVK